MIQTLLSMDDLELKLSGLYDELHQVAHMDESEVCRRYNADSKAEIIALINEEISSIKDELYGDFEALDDVLEDRMQICLSQGLSY